MGIRAYHIGLILSPFPTFTARLTSLGQAVSLDSASQALTGTHRHLPLSE